MKIIVNQFSTSVLKYELIVNDFDPLGREAMKLLAVNSSFFEIEACFSTIILNTVNIITFNTFLGFPPDISEIE